MGVQIPLWTIVTRRPTRLSAGPGIVQIPLWTIVTFMFEVFMILLIVQIPLWTIVTAELAALICGPGMFRFLYGRL